MNLPDPTAAVEQLLAWGVREGVTNVLRHSDARACSIRVGRGGGSIRLELVNDGAQQGRTPHGSGLHGLTGRAESLSGTVTVTRAGDRFRLAVDIPAEAR